MKKSQHKIPASLMQTRIKQQVEEKLKDFPVNQQQIEQLNNELANKKQQLLDQAKRHQSRVEELINMKSVPSQLVPMIKSKAIHLGFFVGNKSSSWKWFSNIAFALIVAVQAFYDALPPELITSLPNGTQSKITVVLAIFGVIGRYINQSKPKPLPPADGDANV